MWSHENIFLCDHVSGHEFTRAVKCSLKIRGFSRWFIRVGRPPEKTRSRKTLALPTTANVSARAIETRNPKRETTIVNPARIADLLAPFLQAPPGLPASLNGAQLEQVSAYLDLLLRWNARINLTAVRDPESMVARHFGESFFTARQLVAAEASLRAIDLGSGAGFPGLPLKIFAPAIRLTLVESSQKKAAFLKEVVRAIALTDVDVFAGRAEDFPATANLVTLRAVERYGRALGAAARLVEPGGRLALLIGSMQATRTPQLLPAFVWPAPIAIPQSSSRVLLIGTNLPG